MALKLKGPRQIQASMLAEIISRLGITDVNVGSVLDVITHSAAQQDFALYYQIAQVSRLVDINALTGDDLDNKAFEYGLKRVKPVKTKGIISILRPSGFVKVSTTFYAGSPSPITGDTRIDVNDASNALIGTSGTLILGRGTNNEEEISYVVAPTDQVNFWRFTLSSPLVNDHVIEETVILKQGNDEVILAGTIVIVPATGVDSEIQFTIDSDATILSGEDSLDGVEITAVTAGKAGNIPVGAIDGADSFPNPPFTGARAYNGSKFTTGKDLEGDDSFRDRIKNYIQGITKAVKQAIKDAIVGLVDPETAKRVVSANIVLPIEEAGAVKIYIDDGLGLEPTFSNVGFETVLEASTGGEERLQTDYFPVAKAQIESNLSEPYDMSSGTLTLQYEVGTISETISFQAADFRFPEIVTAEEIVSIINDRSTLLEARTSEIGTYVLVTAKRDVNESLRITGGTANNILSFPTDRKDTLNLYLDDVKLSKDGQTATLDSGNISPYNLIAVGAFPHELNIVVDGKTANPMVATLNSSDVSDTSAVTVTEICAVLNRDLVGIVASPIDNSTKVRLESLTKLSDASKIHITGGSMNDATNGLNFSTVQAVGIDGDYIFNRELGIIQLNTPLVADQNVTIGSIYTRGKLITDNPELYSPANGDTLVISVDGGGNQTITFDNTFLSGKTAEQTASYINATLKGATASVRVIGSNNYLQISTNTYTSNGSIRIQASSTANTSFGFSTNTTVSSDTANKAFLVSGNSGPFSFVEDDTLVVVLNTDIVNSTYSVRLNYDSVVSLASSTTIFRASTLTSVFPNVSQLVGYYVSFKTGANTDTGIVNEVALQGGGIARYSFSTIPTSLATFAAGDLFGIVGLTDSENNGHFRITAVGASYVDVSNSDALVASSESGNGTLAQRRQISAYNNLTGQVTVSSAFSHAPQVADSLFVIPSSISNLVDYMNNTKITSLSLKAVIEGVLNNTKLQISSILEGSDGYVQVTGGNSNKVLAFNTTVYRGLAAYAYWTGLIKLVHKTVYGDDSDTSSFDGVGAAGITFRILAPTIRQLEIELDVTLATGVTISSLENDVKSVVSGYVNTLGVGEDVIIEKIRAAVINVSGIVDVVINTPTANIAIADNELAKVSDTDILVG